MPCLNSQPLPLFFFFFKFLNYIKKIDKTKIFRILFKQPLMIGEKFDLEVAEGELDSLGRKKDYHILI